MEFEAQREVLVNSTQVAAQGLSGILSDMEIKEQIEFCRKFVKPIRFFSDKSGYFYIYDMKGMNIAHATQPEKEGKDLYEYRDSKGNLLIQGLIKAAAEGGGFVDFWWENP
jgi:signal transduction histidine kinase